MSRGFPSSDLLLLHFIFFVSYATCCPFHSKVISTEESGLNQGRIQGGAPGARPPKIGKNMIFWRNFSHEIPQQFSRLPPLGAIFLSAPPLTLNPGFKVNIAA